MDLRERRGGDGKVADVAYEVDQFSRVGEVATGVGPVGRWVAREGEDVRDARAPVLIEQGHQFGTRVTDTRQMGHRGKRLLPVDPHDRGARRLPGDAQRPVGDRYE